MKEELTKGNNYNSTLFIRISKEQKNKLFEIIKEYNVPNISVLMRKSIENIIFNYEKKKGE